MDDLEFNEHVKILNEVTIDSLIEQLKETELALDERKRIAYCLEDIIAIDRGREKNTVYYEKEKTAKKTWLKSLLAVTTGGLIAVITTKKKK